MSSRIVVKLMKDTDTNRRFIRVEIVSHSLLATGKLKSQIDLYPDEVGSERDFEKRIEVSAATLAEHQCQKYGDKHDPASCAKAALDAWRDLKRRFEKEGPQEGQGQEAER